MRRQLVIVLAAALFAAPIAALSLHVHRYTGHVHPEHVHGAAAHIHAPSPSGLAHEDDAHDDDHHDDHLPATSTIGSCDPGRHAVSVWTGVLHQPLHDLVIAILPAAVRYDALRPLRASIAMTEVRAHGPPPDRDNPSRAPPLMPAA